MMSSIHGEREEEKWGNNEAVLETNAFGEKLTYIIESLTIKIT